MSNGMKTNRTFPFALVLALGGATTLLAAGGDVSRVTPRGTGGFVDSVPADQEIGLEFRQAPLTNMSFQKFISGAVNPARVPSAMVPTPPGVNALGPLQGAFGFDGLTHRDQRVADGGNQFSLEPPDQGLAVSGGYVLEAVNNAIAVYDAVTKLPLTSILSMHQFFGLPHEFNRTTGAFGPLLSDPKCYFDGPTQRWFVTELEIDQDPVTGAFLGHSEVLIAVSNTSNPTGSYTIYHLDVTNDGTNFTPTHAHCPCFGDQPLIGADANAFFVSTNEFSISPFGAFFNGAQIYGLDKVAMAAGLAANVQHFVGGPLEEGISYTVQPATVPPGGSFETAQGGTEYFLSALEFFGTLDNRIAVWAATNTGSITLTTPNLALQHIVIGSEIYGQPPAQQQPLVTPSQFCGPSAQAPNFVLMPLACFLQDGSLFGQVFKEHEELIASNDDRMQQTVFAAGHLWSGLNTVVKTKNGPTRTAAAFFIVDPGFNGSSLTATMHKQGYVAVNNASVTFPSIGVNSSGKGVVGFSLIGPGIFPSTAYAKIDATNGAGAIVIAGKGTLPDDGFTGYQSVGGSHTARWGDYSAAVADSDGKVWLANEYIPSLSRTIFANWGTFVSKVDPN